MKNKVVKLLCALSLLLPVYTVYARDQAKQDTHTLVYMDEKVCESILACTDLFPDHSWSNQCMMLRVDIADKGNVAPCYCVESVVNECLSLDPANQCLIDYKQRLQEAKVSVNPADLEDDADQITTRGCGKKSKKFCKLCVCSLTAAQLHVTGNATIDGALAVGGDETIAGALAVGGNETVGGNLAVGGTITAGTCVLTCTPTGLVITTAAGAVTIGSTSTIAGAQYVQLGAQDVAAGQPFTFTTDVLTTPGIVKQVAGIYGSYTASGTVFQLVAIGRYEVNYQATYLTPGGVDLYTSPTLNGTYLPLPYTMIGTVTATGGQVAGSVIIETTTANSFLSVNAAAGNAAVIGVPGNSSTTNQNATTVSIKQIS